MSVLKCFVYHTKYFGEIGNPIFNGGNRERIFEV
jgi:hypothetical protein